MKYIPYLILAIAISSCVSTSTYESALFSRDSLQTEFDSIQYVMKMKNNHIADLEGQIADYRKQITEARDQINSLMEENEAQMKEMNKLAMNSSEEMMLQFAKLDSMQSEIEVREAKIREFNYLLSERDRKAEELKEKLNNALLGFKDKGLSVEMKDGKVYVSLSNKLLFATGSTQIDKSGKDALLGLSQILNEQLDIDITVEGHTDTQAIRPGARFVDNWDLSVLRATEVVRYITTDGNVDPKRITASGRSKYFPLVEGEEEEALASNRRTEIILTPKLDQIYQFINDN